MSPTQLRLPLIALLLLATGAMLTAADPVTLVKGQGARKVARGGDD